MKKFLAKIVLFIGICGLLTVLPCVIIDPYNVFHWSNVRENGVEPNKNYIKVKYILANPDKFESLLFGSSRAGVIHVENIEDEKCYNMSYSEGIPHEYLDNLKTLTENGVNIKKVYISIDSLAYTLAPEQHYYEMRYPYEKLDLVTFCKTYLRPNMVFDSLDTIFETRNTRTENYSNTFYEYGWWCDYGVETLTEEDVPGLIPYIGYDYCFEEALEDIRQIKELCEENGIEAVFFTNPMQEVTYKESVDNDYYEFLEAVAEITDYWNFSCLNDITTGLDYYFDSSHYIPEIGDTIMETVNGKTHLNEDLVATGFGYYTTKDTVKNLIKILESQYTADTEE
ncbi:MAG: hypothetical protein K6F37_01090 [Lachnospiraceae bacterium]|nr:hypothetical protein [Lachnospiraceae bacterium]